jgi:hypothetical protein
MSEPFIITGLPRSRTAWLAALCNTVPEAICYHEPLATMPRWDGVVGLLRDARYRYAGASDSGLGFHLSELMAVLRPRVLIVSRGREDVAASLRAILPGGGVERFLAVLAGRLDPLRDDPAVMVVDFAALSRVRTVCACLRHLMPEATICPSKVEEFGRLNVQACTDQVIEAARVSAACGWAEGQLGADVLAELAA